MKIYKNKLLLSFIGGALTFTVGKDMVTSKKAKRYYAEVLAKGLKFNDDIRTAYEDIKEEAEDIYDEAKDIHEQELVCLEKSDD